MANDKLRSERKIESALERLLELQAQIVTLKSLYKELDAIYLFLEGEGFTSQEHKGKLFKLRDNFASRNTSFSVAFVKRFEVEITDLTSG